MKHSEPLILNKEEFFEGFDNPSLQEKVVGVKIALLQNDNGEIGLGLGIEAPPLHSREIEEINRFFAKKYNVDEMIQKLLQHYQDQRSQNADSKSQSDRKYEITDIAHPQYPWLHRIRALQDVREDVHQGDLRYRLTEIATRDGSTLMTTVLYDGSLPDVNGDTEITDVKITAVNNRNFELPNSGGNGFPMAAVGVALMFISLLFAVCFIRRSRKAQ